MQKEIEVGDYLLSLHPVPKAAPAVDGDGATAGTPPERYAIRASGLAWASSQWGIFSLRSEGARGARG